MDLVIVESPAKAKTIEKYLGSGYKVAASVGHIIDLPPGELAVDIENGFKPTYAVIEGKQKVIDSLKKSAKNAETIYLAPDPDREGEAIAWHIAQQIKGKNKVIKRVLFNEITKKGILDGIENTCEINENRVKAQQSRRILDRLVGYLISPLLWKPLKSGLSAGRVQSVALRLICEREREIETFVPVESWSVEADFEIKGGSDGQSGILKSKLDKINGKKANIKTEQDADNLLNNLPDSFNVASVEKKEVKTSPTPPFITSRMQQEAIRRLNFTAKKVMSVAQQLYEGVELGSDGPVGLITYMRTDSVRISPEAAEECASYIKTTYGDEYLAKKKRPQKKSAANVQDAHEAIRPTSVLREPNKIKQFLSTDQYKLYKLIWERFVASQMSDAIFDQTTVQIAGGELIFKSSARVMKFPGFSA
ncbi:MAG: type I DNA topoisomerase, partial [Deferribacterales bacterium]|nr:type I DNA topoisomerase [Deferribacterales bacterium]